MIQTIIITNLLHDASFFTKYITKLERYQFDEDHGVIFDKIHNYYTKFDKKPSKVEVKTDLDGDKKIGNELLSKSTSILRKKFNASDYSEEWLNIEVQKFIKEQRIKDGISKLITLQQKKTDTEASYVEIIEEAININFDETVGYDYLETLQERFENYSNKADKFPMPIKKLNEVTNGGVEKGTLNNILAGTGVGKSLLMCNFAKHSYESGLNVVYITLEMSEEKIAQRIDANFLLTDQNDLEEVDKRKIDNLEKNLRIKNRDNFFRIQQYPTGQATSNDIFNFIKNLESKTEKKVDMLFVDYIGILGTDGFVNSKYEKGSTAVEELRAVAIKLGIPVWTAQQLNREGSQSVTPTNADIADSFAITFACDFNIAITETHELRETSNIMVTQLKTRYGSIDKDNHKFLITVDKAKAKVFDESVSINPDINNSNTNNSKPNIQSSLDDVIF